MLKYILSMLILASSLYADLHKIEDFITSECVFIIDINGNMWLEFEYHLYKVPQLIHDSECQRCDWDDSDYDLIRPN